MVWLIKPGPRWTTSLPCVIVILFEPVFFRAISSYRNGEDKRPRQIVQIHLKPWLVSNALRFHWLKQSHVAKPSISGVEKYTPPLSLTPYS